VGLLFFLILKNIASGFFPDPNLRSPPMVIQYAMAYGMGFLMGAYFPYYFYKAFELDRLRWHALYGVPLFILLPFAVIFPGKFINGFSINRLGKLDYRSFKIFCQFSQFILGHAL
jgi:hypothetical protein